MPTIEEVMGLEINSNIESLTSNPTKQMETVRDYKKLINILTIADRYADNRIVEIEDIGWVCDPWKIMFQGGILKLGKNWFINGGTKVPSKEITYISLLKKAQNRLSYYEDYMFKWDTVVSVPYPEVFE